VRLAAFAAAVLCSLGCVGALDWWLDPFGDRYDAGALRAALGRGTPCFVSWEVVGEQAWPDFKLDLARAREARTVVVGTSRIAKIGAWPGERGFANLGVPGMGAESLVPLFRRLRRQHRGGLTVYLDADAFWFGHRFRNRISFTHAYIRDLKQLLSGETLSASLGILRRAPGSLLHPRALRAWEIERTPRGCIVDRGRAVVNGAANAWGPDGTLYFQYELVNAPTPPRSTLARLYHPFYLGSRMDPGHVRALEHALAVAREYGWRVVGFQPPIGADGIRALAADPSTAGLWRDYRRRIASIFRRYGFRYLDLTTTARAGCRPGAFSFRDDGHPNAACGRAIRRRLDAAARAAE
jgi:hypothetical protein